MKVRHMLIDLLPSLAAVTIAIFPVLGPRAAAQNPELQQRVAEVKQSAAENKQALAHYAWQQQTTAIKGEVKDTKLFQVHIGPDGKPQKVEITNTTSSSGGGGRLKKHIVKKKKEEYQDYGEQIGALAQQYAQPDPVRLQLAFQQGNVMLGSGGVPGKVKMEISNYVKPNDKVTLIFDRQAKAIQSLNIATYLDDPKNAVNIGAQYSQLPDGTNHVANMHVDGVSKNLQVTTQNSNYQKIM
ncbi:MAG TPA: hypothetical protein VFA74_12740 [Terriglobales bacterium]|nr:hypothetical protein [Terriglobales bacterium]